MSVSFDVTYIQYYCMRFVDLNIFVTYYVTVKTKLNYLFTKIRAHTIIAERPVEGGQTAVARVSVVFLNTFPSILAMHSIAAAVTRASRLHPWCDLCPALKVK